MITYDEFEKFAFSDYAIEEKIVNVIDGERRQVLIESVSELLSYTNYTIKVQSMEKYNQTIYAFCNRLRESYNHLGPVTCHAFRSFENSLSFNLHTDPDNVFLYICEGTKIMTVMHDDIELNARDTLYIPANTPHKANNKHPSLMLSFGLEKFMCDKADYGLDNLSKDN